MTMVSQTLCPEGEACKQREPGKSNHHLHCASRSEILPQLTGLDQMLLPEVTG